MSEPGNKFYIATGQQVACLERASGDIRWQTRIKALSSPTSIALDKSVPGALVAQPKTHVVPSGNTKRTVVAENTQYQG